MKIEIRLQFQKAFIEKHAIENEFNRVSACDEILAAIRPVMNLKGERAIHIKNIGTRAVVLLVDTEPGNPEIEGAKFLAQIQDYDSFFSKAVIVPEVP